jgi:UDP-N-acetylmuramyl tripeptide synthase
MRRLRQFRSLNAHAFGVTHQMRVFTVAGTNGKGTTCRTLETVLMAAGYKVGVYSSPERAVLKVGQRDVAPRRFNLRKRGRMRRLRQFRSLNDGCLSRRSWMW